MEWTVNNKKYGEIIGIPSNENEGKTIILLRLEELQLLKEVSPETILINIFGKESKAIDCDEDTRMGYVAFGKLKEK